MIRTPVSRRRPPVPPRAAVVCAGILVAAGAAAGQAPGQPPGSAAAGQPAKTIQVLTDVPTAQMIPTMRVISASLGVECEFCHESNRTLNTAKKDVARKMMTMTRALNTASFGGAQPRVTCYTCHRGSTAPLAAPTPTGQYTTAGVGVLFKGNGAPVPGGQDAVLSARFREYTANERSGLPAPDQIFARYLEALGGEPALRRITTRTITAMTEVPADVRGVGPAVHALTQQYFKAPNQWTITSQTASGTTATGFDGTVAWRQDARGVVTETTGAAPAPPLARVKRNADFYEPLNLKQAYTRLIVRGTVRVRDRDAYLVAAFPDGDLPEQLFFDTQSGLLVRKETGTSTAFGDYTMQTDYDDYRDVGGVKMPYLIRTIGISPADGGTTRVEKVAINPPIDAGLFIKPASK